MEATIESLVDVGYSATTIRAVADRAGVSQGAQSHHFPHRVDLVASAFEHMAEQRIASYAERASRLSGGHAERLRKLLDMLWDDFSSPLFTVAAKLWVASADDGKLRERLVPVERRIYEELARTVRGIAGELARDPEFDRKLAVAINTVAGLALVTEFQPSDQARGGSAWTYHRAALERMLAG